MKSVIYAVLASLVLAGTSWALTPPIGSSNLRCNNDQIIQAVGSSWACKPKPPVVTTPDLNCNRVETVITPPILVSGNPPAAIFAVAACQVDEVVTGGGCEPESRIFMSVLAPPDRPVMSSAPIDFDNGTDIVDAWQCVTDEYKVEFNPADVRDFSAHAICCKVE
jgi:hypothetical protein